MKAALILFCAAAAATAASPVLADVVTICRAPAGKSIQPAGPAGWTDENLAGSTVTVTNDRVAGYDVETKLPGGAVTASGSGARIRRIQGDDSAGLTLSVEYAAGTVEVYQLALDDKGAGTMLMASLKSGAAGGTKGSLLTANCTRP